MKKTGIEYHPGRKQPFTVWYKGRVIQFCVLLDEAQLVLDNAPHQYA